MDTGGLAQMTLPNLHPAGTLGVPGSGFASRGKGHHIKHLSMSTATTPVAGLADGAGLNTPTSALPKTSRSHLLAGLRTAPRTPTAPPSAPPMRVHHDDGLGMGAAARMENARGMPRTATASAFPAQMVHPMALNPLNTGRQMYSLPEQVLAPPAISIGAGPGEEHMDPDLYADLVATNLYLAQQQQRLQQQLISVTAAAQIQGLTLNSPTAYGAPMLQPGTSFSPTAAFFNANIPVGLQSFAMPAGLAQPGMYSVVEPREQQAASTDFGVPPMQRRPSPPRADADIVSPLPTNSRFKMQTSPPPPFAKTNNNNNSSGNGQPRNPSPKSLHTPTLPPPSANAFRAGHKKATSMACVTGSHGGFGRDLASPYGPKSAGIPPTPLTGTFGPGQGRAGEHPARQPRGPPPLEELVASPTSRHEGSKNFATRQRRRAVHSLVRAGMERRGGRGNGSTGSAGNTTPASETDVTFSLPSDNESDGFGGGARSRKPSIGSIRAAANGAIGSERKSRKEGSPGRESVQGHCTAASVSSDEGASVGGPLVEVKAGQNDDGAQERRKTPMLVLTSAAKRKSSMF